ncbi:lipopolysaccharide assembly protein LapB [Novosphingobium sp. AP12]|uniref:tetratricopeptide repeat protein n=1 Tax=Novosphingobium sp. AP12 TaxID=1144305 RepID=UPI000271F647|nr:SPOR domain-containing protein [Novosphingobium sp. AP12]EJL26314.1 sporulation related protein [Novosphingobium sp. AP12]
MERLGSSARNAGFTLCSAMVAALLAGCSGQPSLASAGSAPMADAPTGGQGEGIADSMVAKAEARVARSASNASARADLAQLYLAAGRFDSAATTFEDAVSLGDQSPRTGLSLALAYIGSGRNAQALEVLSHWRDKIPAGDFGLAVALAGQPAQGVALLTDTLRGGENSATVRQNLAYAYALDGRWSQARVVASQDVPGDQLDARIAEWASHARAEQAQSRVAGLLGTPLRSDPGQPAALALGGVERAPRMALADTAETAAVSAPAAVADAELPPVESGESFWGAGPSAQVASAIVPAAAEAAAPASQPDRTTIERAFADFPKPPPRKPAAPRVQPAKAQPARAAAQGSHLVQLGSFATMEGAQRAWGIYLKRNPALRDHAMRITEAQVHGRRYFRVAAEGFDRSSAEGMCSTVKRGGEACLAIVDTRPQPRGLPAGPMLARSR